MQLNVAMIMGSISDAKQIAPAILGLKSFVKTVNVVSAHRTPERMLAYAKTAPKKDIHIIIAAAGGSAHLQGMTASEVDPIIPVFAIPISGRTFGRIDSFESCIQMPPGIPLGVFSKPESISIAIQNINHALSSEYDPKILVLYDEHLNDPFSTLSEQWLFEKLPVQFVKDTTLSPTIQKQINQGTIQMIIDYTEKFLLAEQLAAPEIPVIFSPYFDKEIIVNLPTDKERDRLATDRILNILQQADENPCALFTSCNGFLNALLLMMRIYGLKYPEIQELLRLFREKMKEDVVTHQENALRRYVETELHINTQPFLNLEK
jgi:5-(carboxyamino)imidazole ribonucleotide mutase